MFHFVMTIQWQPAPGAIGMRTEDGVYTPPPEVTTRADAYAAICKYVAAKAGVDASKCNVVFFSMERNDLSV